MKFSKIFTLAFLLFNTVSWCGNCNSSCVAPQPVISPLAREILDCARETGRVVLTGTTPIMLTEDDWVELFGPDMNPSVTEVDLSDVKFLLLLDSHREYICLLLQTFPNLSHVCMKSCALGLLPAAQLANLISALSSIRSLRELDLSDNGLSVEQGMSILRTLPHVAVYVCYGIFNHFYVRKNIYEKYNQICFCFVFVGTSGTRDAAWSKF